MIDQQLIDYLKGRIKSKWLMSPEQLAEEIGIPSRQQSKLRKAGRLPVPFRSTGRLIYYSIYDLSNILLNGETTPVREVPEPLATPSPVKKKPDKATAPVEDLSYIFAQRFYTIFERTGYSYPEPGREPEELCQQERNDGELCREVSSKELLQS